MPKFTDEERRRINVLQTMKQIPEAREDVEFEIQQLYHEVERREDLEIKKAEIAESKKANKISKIAIIISIASAVITAILSIVTLCA